MVKLDLLRHSAAHILAIAVKNLYPKVKLGIGPAIEDGFYYDFDNLNITENDLPKIEKEMQKIIDRKLLFKKIKTTKEKAKKLLKDELYKLDLLREIKQPSFYQTGNFIDLCAGPHIKNTSGIKAFKLLSIAGAYWRGDSKNKMLTRIYGIAFPSKKELDDYVRIKEEAEKRNHIKLGKQLDLFSFHTEAPGFPFFKSKGMILVNELKNFMKEKYKKYGYKEVQTPLILNKELWLRSGHWDHYRENMYFTKIEEKDFAVKPMNCPGSILIYKEDIHSYKEFPLRLAEMGLVHRHELSGVLNGLFRARAFIQDDAHCFVTEDQIKEEIINIINMTDEIYKTFDFNYHVELSTRPKKAMGSKKVWDIAEKDLANALKEKKIGYKINKGEGAFYGPKIDFHIKDSLGRTWQCATIQVDFSMPEKFELTYEGKDGKKHTPVMIHRALYGSLERFIGILIEHYAGEFPLWITPIQIILLPITDRNIEFAKELEKKFKENNLRVELDDRKETLQKKVYEAQKQKIPLTVTIGDKEQKNKTLAIRTLDGKVKFNVEIDSFIKETLEKIKNKC